MSFSVPEATPSSSPASPFHGPGLVQFNAAVLMGSPPPRARFVSQHPAIPTGDVSDEGRGRPAATRGAAAAISGSKKRCYSQRPSVSGRASSSIVYDTESDIEEPETDDPVPARRTTRGNKADERFVERMRSKSLPVKQQRTARSNIWDHCRRIENAGKTAIAICAYCSEKFPKSTATSLSTGEVKDHMLHAHGINLRTSTRTAMITTHQADKLNFALAIAMLLEHWALRTPFSRGFRLLACVLNPGWIPCSPKTILDKHVKGKLLATCKAAISAVVASHGWFTLCMDAWSTSLSPQFAAGSSAVGICVSTVDEDFNRRKHTLGVREGHGSLDTTNYKAILDDLLEDSGIPVDYVLNVATDNHSTESCVVREMISATPTLKHSRCFPHTLNLAVEDGLSQVCCLHDSLIGLGFVWFTFL